MNVAKHSLSKSNPPQPTTDQESPSLFDEPQAAKPAQAESEALLHGLFEYAPAAIIVVDSQGYIARLNAQAETMFGYSRAELLGQPLELLLPERFRKQHVAYRLGYMIEARLRPMGAGLELFGRRKDGTELAVDIMLSPLESSEEAIVIAVIRDVTERKRSQEKFQGLLESAPDAMVIVNQDGQIVLVNAQTEELFGYKRDQLLGQSVEMLLPEQFRLSHIKHRQNYFMAPQTRSMGRGLELYGLRQDGETFPIEVSLSTLETEDGLLVSSAIRDITKRKQIEAEQAQLAAIVESSDVAIIGKNLDGIITSWNRGAERIYGYTVDEVKGQSVSLLVPPNQPDETPQIMQKIRQGEVTEQYETVRIRKDGSSIHVALAVSPIKDTNGHIVGASVIARDISERKQAETQLRASLKEKEALLKEIHHRVKNNLQIISSLLKLQASYIQDTETQALFQESQHRIRAMALVHETLYLSQDLAQIDFARYVRQLTHYLLSVYGGQSPDIEIQLDLKETLLDLDRAIACGLIIGELVSNALKYAFPPPDGQTGIIHVELWPVNESQIRLTIRDNGVGFPAHLDFRQTETLGLQLVNALVTDELDGIIELNRNETGLDHHQGASFEMVFPG